MNVSFRIVKVDPTEHGILVRYFTDKVTETDLATSFDANNNIKLHADGYPLSTRTDMFMSIYKFPTPPYEEIKKDIITRAPIEWLNLQEKVKDKTVDTSLTELKNHQGDSETYTTDEIKVINEAMFNAALANTSRPSEANVAFSYANTDPKLSSALANLVIEAIHSGTTIPL